MTSYKIFSLVASCLFCVMLVRVALFDLCFPGLFCSSTGCPAVVGWSPLPLIKAFQTGPNGSRLHVFQSQKQNSIVPV